MSLLPTLKFVLILNKTSAFFPLVFNTKELSKEIQDHSQNSRSQGLYTRGESHATEILLSLTSSTQGCHSLAVTHSI